jgi:hypothetical protein
MMLDHMGLPQRNATIIFEDNTACIAMSQNPVERVRSKHIDLRRMYIKELNRRQIVRLVQVGTAHMHADYLTKPLAADPLRFHHRYTCGYDV